MTRENFQASPDIREREKRMEVGAIYANQFLDEVLIPVDKKLRLSSAMPLGDLLDPLFKNFIGDRKITCLERDDVFSVLNERVKHPVSDDDLGQLKNIREEVERWRGEHRKAEGDDTIDERREIKQMLAEIRRRRGNLENRRERGREKLHKRAQRREKWLRKWGITESDLLNFILTTPPARL